MLKTYVYFILIQIPTYLDVNIHFYEDVLILKLESL